MKQKIILRKKAKSLEPVLMVGKKGLMENAIKELSILLKNKKLIKIKLLKSAIQNKNKKELINEIVEKTGSELVEAVGNVVVLHKK